MTVTDEFSHLRVLLVDDEPFVRKVTAAVLAGLNIHALLEAENGREAVALLERNPVDLLISDIQMPEMNGIELIKQIRSDHTGADRGLRTIVVTSFSNTEVLGSCLLLDVNGFLVKPITAESAVEKIQVAMSERKNLNSTEAYQQVKSDLESLAEINKEEKKRVNASIPREPVDHSVAGGRLVELAKLKPGMELLEDLYARNGVRLLSAGWVANEGLINRLLELRPVIDNREIWVRSGD